jgi:hypothetical protein
VLFDTGPDRLGRPRIAQLAALVVLARRASAARAELRWGTLHSHGRYPAAGDHAIERFLASRTLQSVSFPLMPSSTIASSSHRFPVPPFAARQLVLREPMTM